jgi:ribosomal protein S18 acetylase RimI-like enzyme
MISYSVRKAGDNDVDRIIELISRLKRLNGEFDPLLKPVGNLEEEVAKYVKELLSDPRSLVLVVDVNGRVEGVLTSRIIDRRFYEPRLVGQISDIYVMPEYRRYGVGSKLISQAEKELRSMGAEMIVAEFPVKNVIAEGFYKKLGFREVTGVFAKEAR